MTLPGTTRPFRHFHDELAKLKERLLYMSRRAEDTIELAVDALITRDKNKAHMVIESDAELNALEIEIEQRGIELLALQQPMATDLRFIIGAIKISNDLERVGDHAVNIAESCLSLLDQPEPVGMCPEIPEMARRARKMLGDALDAFIRSDGALGRAVCSADDEVDALHDSVFRIMLTHMMEDPRTITPSLELLLVSRNLERVADLATNISEDAVYLAEAKLIKHRSEERR